MALIPDHPKEQLLFFFDNPLVAAEPGGNALIGDFLTLLAPLVGRGGDGGGSSSSGPAWSDPGGSSTPPEGSSADVSGGKGGGNHGTQADAALGAIVGLVAGIARGDLDL